MTNPSKFLPVTEKNNTSKKSLCNENGLERRTIQARFGKKHKFHKNNKQLLFILYHRNEFNYVQIINKPLILSHSTILLIWFLSNRKVYKNHSPFFSIFSLIPLFFFAMYITFAQKF